MAIPQSVHRRFQQARPGSFVPMTTQEMMVAPEIEEAPPAKPSLEVGSRLLGIVPRNIDEIFRLASAIHKSGLAPKDMNTPEKLTVAIMTGLELGLPPIFAINKIAVINGRPTLWGDAIPGLLWSRGFKIEEAMTGDGENRCATCTVTRPQGAQVTRTFGVKDAKKANLWGKAGPWQQYPDRMLAMRARAFAARDGASDVLGGLYLREEIDDTPSELVDITPPEKPKRVVGRSPNGRKTAYAAKKDGTNDVFNAIRKQVLEAPECEALQEIYDRYTQELADLPTAYMLILSREFEDKWQDLGGNLDESPVRAPEWSEL
jgi:hypothetical protein